MSEEMFLQKMDDYIALVDNALSKYLENPGGYAALLWGAMEYSVFPGGKRLRPLLLIGACEAAGGQAAEALPFACGLEMIHSYSLIHDDLPAMDDDDTRRGKPSCHIQYGEATAILAGDGLLNLAFEAMSEICAELFLPARVPARVKAMNVIARASGAYGMVAGQKADMLYENQLADANALGFIHINKTAALFSAAFEAGALLGGADTVTAKAYGEAGRTLGLAFQIMDDIFDETADESILGKPVKSDAKNKKNTYISVYGMEQAKAEYTRLSGEAARAVGELAGKHSFLSWLTEHTSARLK